MSTSYSAPPSSRPERRARRGETPVFAPAHLPAGEPGDYPLVVLAGPTAAGKSALALRLAEEFHGEIVSCDSVAVYRGMDIGSAKTGLAARSRIPHHGLDLLEPSEFCTAGDYARHARTALAGIRSRGRLPIVAGGTGLYLRALLDGLAPAPPRDEALRERLRSRAARRGSMALHRLLSRFDAAAAAIIHPNDTPKLIRSLEVTLTARQPQTAQWIAGRDPLAGFRRLTLLLEPPRPALHDRINARAAAMFAPPHPEPETEALPTGLLKEAAGLRARFGDSPRAFGALGYAQAMQVLRGELSREQAIEQAQAGHRQYAKRQITWFRNQLREPLHRLAGFGGDPEVQGEAVELVRTWLGEGENRTTMQTYSESD